MGDDLVGFVSGYLIPGRPDTLFVWQVAISERVRGRGLATKLLKQLLARPVCSEATWLETTITASNTASWALFQGLADKLDADSKTNTLFDKTSHFNGNHESEQLIRIGPLVR